MRRSRVLKSLARFGLLVGAFCIGGLAGGYYERSFQPPREDSPIQLASSSADMALAVAERGDFEQASILIRQAIRRAGHDPESYSYVWNAIQRTGNRSGAGKWYDALRRELVANLDAAMLDVASADDFSKLYSIRSMVLATPSAAAPDSSHKPGASDRPDSGAAHVGAAEPPSSRRQDSNSLIAESAGMMRAGLQSLAHGDEDRAELLVQAALKGQAEQPNSVPALWKEYKRYLETGPKLTPYDRLARLSAYLDSIDVALLACRNVADFEVVWAIRTEIVDAREKSRADLLAEVLKDVDELTAELTKGSGAQSTSDALRRMASLNDKLKPKLLVVLATGRDKGQVAGQASESLRALLGAANGVAHRAIERLKKRADLAAEVDRGDKAAGPAVSDQNGDHFGEFEKILRDTRELSQALEAADLHSWVLMVSPASNKGEDRIKRSPAATSMGESGFGGELNLNQARFPRFHGQLADAAQRRNTIGQNARWRLR